MGQVPLEKLSQQLSGSRSKRTFGTVFPHGNPESHAASCTPDSGAQVCRPMTATFTRGGNRSNPKDTASPPPRAGEEEKGLAVGPQPSTPRPPALSSIPLPKGLDWAARKAVAVAAW